MNECMSNNIFLGNNDPLLYGKSTPVEYPQYPVEFYRQQMMQPPVKDYISDLDQEIKNLDPMIIAQLNQDQKFIQLNAQFQQVVQEEMLNIIRNKLNSNPLVVDNIKKQIDVIKEVSNSTKEKERQNMYELNDYMQNYSHLTFDEYKRLKSGEEISVENKTTKKR